MERSLYTYAKIISTSCFNISLCSQVRTSQNFNPHLKNAQNTFWISCHTTLWRGAVKLKWCLWTIYIASIKLFMVAFQESKLYSKVFQGGQIPEALENTILIFFTTECSSLCVLWFFFSSNICWFSLVLHWKIIRVD